MLANKYGEIVVTEDDLCDLYLTDPIRSSVRATVVSNIQFDSELELENIPQLTVDDPNNTLTVAEYDHHKQSNWHMPTEYAELDIASWLLDQCTTDEQRDRVGQELLLYLERGLFPLLQYLKYLVDTMRVNNVVWGVGRGSSVSSYVLYLIGVHRIDSLKYNLDISEFLR